MNNLHPPFGNLRGGRCCLDIIYILSGELAGFSLRVSFEVYNIWRLYSEVLWWGRYYKNENDKYRIIRSNMGAKYIYKQERKGYVSDLQNHTQKKRMNQYLVKNGKPYYILE